MESRSPWHSTIGKGTRGKNQWPNVLYSVPRCLATCGGKCSSFMSLDLNHQTTREHYTSSKGRNTPKWSIERDPERNTQRKRCSEQKRNARCQKMSRLAHPIPSQQGGILVIRLGKTDQIYTPRSANIERDSKRRVGWMVLQRLNSQNRTPSAEFSPYFPRPCWLHQAYRLARNVTIALVMQKPRSKIQQDAIRSS